MLISNNFLPFFAYSLGIEFDLSDFDIGEYRYAAHSLLNCKKNILIYFLTIVLITNLGLLS